MIDVSVIVVNLNTRDLLRACLRSVEEERPAVALETIVIDNGSTDGSVAMVEEDFPAARLVKNTVNEGFARPNNVGMRMAIGRMVFLLNSDAELRPGALAGMVRFLEAHPRAGACGPRLVFPDGRPQPSVKGFPSLWTHVCDMLFLDRLFPHSRLFSAGECAGFAYDREARVDHVMAAAFLVRREVLDQTGLLDERFRIYYNDMDWCYRIVQHGWEIWYTPASVVAHHLGTTVSRLNRRFAVFHELYDNTILFYQKRYGRWSVPLYKLVLVGGFLLRAPAWTLIHLVRRTEVSTMMRAFSWKSLLYGLKFWVPLPYRDAE